MEGEFSNLCRALRTNDPTATQVQYAYNFFNGHVQQLGEAIVDNTIVQDLELTVACLLPHQAVDTSPAHALLSFLQTSRSLRTVSLDLLDFAPGRGSSFHATMIRDILDALAMSHVIACSLKGSSLYGPINISFDWSMNSSIQKVFFDLHSSLSHIGSVLSQSRAPPTLETLILSGNPRHVEAAGFAAGLTHFLQTTRAIRTVEFHWIRLDTASMVELVTALASHPTLAVLRFKHCSMDADATAFYTRHVQTNVISYTLAMEYYTLHRGADPADVLAQFLLGSNLPALTWDSCSVSGWIETLQHHPTIRLPTLHVRGAAGTRMDRLLDLLPRLRYLQNLVLDRCLEYGNETRVPPATPRVAPLSRALGDPPNASHLSHAPLGASPITYHFLPPFMRPVVPPPRAFGPRKDRGSRPTTALVQALRRNGSLHQLTILDGPRLSRAQRRLVQAYGQRNQHLPRLLAQRHVNAPLVNLLEVAQQARHLAPTNILIGLLHQVDYTHDFEATSVWNKSGPHKETVWRPWTHLFGSIVDLCEYRLVGVCSAILVLALTLSREYTNGPLGSEDSS